MAYPGTGNTIADIFAKLGLIEWWNAQVTQSFGENGEKGADYGLGGFGKPVGSISAGKVIYVGDGGYPGSSIGQIVQVEADDGSIVHYQHLKTSNVNVGQTVTPGDVIGTGGGCPVGGYPSPLQGNACTFYDNFSSGQHIEVRYSPTYKASGGVWDQAWEDPRTIFKNMGNGVGVYVPAPSSPGSSSPTTSINWGGEGTKIGLFVLGLTFLAIGIYILFQKQVDNAAKSAAGGAAGLLAKRVAAKEAATKQTAKEDALVKRVKDREAKANLTPEQRQQARAKAAEKTAARHKAEKAQAEAILKKRSGKK